MKTLEELRANYHRAAQEHYRAGARYYAGHGKSTKVDQELAEQYNPSGEMYLTVLYQYEQHLLSLERDEEIESEIMIIQALMRALETLLKYL